jgi:DNA-binding IclR family transcriptional regulator
MDPMTGRSVSSPGRILRVLDLFNERQSTWTAEAITEALQVSLPTGYRYVRLLVEAGLLQRAADSHYALGPRIIMLDHYIRMSDPVLAHGLPFMRELVERTGLDCVISGLYGQQVIETHREFGNAPAALSYGRGQPRSLFLGAARVILACFTSAQLRKIFNQHQDDIRRAGLPEEWNEFRKFFGAIRKAGHYFSNGEFEPHLAGVTAPMQKPDGSILGAITLVSTVQRMAVIDLPKLSQLVMRAARDITERIP